MNDHPEPIKLEPELTKTSPDLKPELPIPPPTLYPSNAPPPVLEPLPSPATVVVGPPPFEPAGFVRRGIAFFIDQLILLVLSLFLGFVGLVSLKISTGTDAPSLALLAGPFVLVSFFLFLAYFAFFHSLGGGQTPGKMIIRIKVVSFDGTLLTPNMALARSFGYLLSGFFFNFGFLLALFTKRKRGLHDFLVQSDVILAP